MRRKLSVDVPYEQYEELEAFATANEMSLAEVVRRALAQFLQKQRALSESLQMMELLPRGQHVIGPDEFMDLGLEE